MEYHSTCLVGVTSPPPPGNPSDGVMALASRDHPVRGELCFLLRKPSLMGRREPCPPGVPGLMEDVVK